MEEGSGEAGEGGALGGAAEEKVLEAGLKRSLEGWKDCSGTERGGPGSLAGRGGPKVASAEEPEGGLTQRTVGRWGRPGGGQGLKIGAQTRLRWAVPRGAEETKKEGVRGSSFHFQGNYCL